MNSLSDIELNYAILVALSTLIILTLINVLYNRKRRGGSNRAEQSAVVQKEQGIPQEKTLESAAQTVAPERSWIERLRSGLSKTQSQLIRGIDEFFLSKDTKKNREDLLESIFEILIQADVGVRTSEKLLERLREDLKGQDNIDAPLIKSLLKGYIQQIFSDIPSLPQGTLEDPRSPVHVMLMVGVNGVGKTTTTGKLAFKAAQQGKNVVVGAADTFRAAAVEQLGVWAQRAKATLIRLKEGADPASVAFETVKQAKAQGAQLCLIDTAGRLQNRDDLMQELAKIKRILSREIPEAPQEVLLVLDATMGQNALIQAKIFQEIVNVTGLVLTKLDGTAKGGISIAIAQELKLPIRYIGVGEAVEDLEVFSPQQFLDALFE